MASQSVRVVNSLKKSLMKLSIDDSTNSDKNLPTSRCLDLLKRLDEVPVNFEILKETLVGIAVSKFKSNTNKEVASSAKALIKKWKKQIEKEKGGAMKPSSSTTATLVKAKSKALMASRPKVTTVVGLRNKYRPK